jgi:hypothetical protein
MNPAMAVPKGEGGGSASRSTKRFIARLAIQAPRSFTDLQNTDRQNDDNKL